MADWYVSGPAYTAIAPWQANTAYTIGQIVRWAGTPNVIQNWTAHRCTAAGTSGATEPTWEWNNNSVTTSGGAQFTNVTGQPAYGWAAAAGNLQTLGDAYSTRPLAGDRVFVSSDHTESIPTFFTIGQGGYGQLSIYSVNRAGSVPPAPADLLPGASITFASGVYLEARSPQLWDGFTITVTSGNFGLNNGQVHQHYFRNCAFVMGAGAGKFVSNNPAKLTFENTTVQFGAIGQGFQPGYAFEFNWFNTPNAIVGTTWPTNLFVASVQCRFAVTCRGVDLSNFNGGFVGSSSNNGGVSILLDSCKVAAGAVRLVGASSGSCGYDEIELVNCDVAGAIGHERANTFGNMLTDRNTVMAGGATDPGGLFSFKLTTLATGNNPGPLAAIETLFFDMENAVVDTPRTATVEIISSVALTTADILLTVNYPGTVGTVLLKSISSRPTDMNPAAALPASIAAWLNIPLTPQTQYLQVTFTARMAGRVRGRVRLIRPNTIAWVNPQLKLA